MAGNLLLKARRDARKYIKNGGAEENIILTSPNNIVFPTTGWVSKHWINFDTDGSAANSKNAHITLDEQELAENDYPVRNADGEVFLRNHRILTPDSTGVNKNYVIKEWFPDETLGLIVCILGDYELD